MGINRLLQNQTLYGLTEWEYFVLRHRNPTNLTLHFISLMLAYLVFGLAIVKQNAWYLLLYPIPVYIGYSGHRFEVGEVRRKDFLSPFSGLYLMRIYYLVAIRKYSSVVEGINLKVENYKKGAQI